MVFINWIANLTVGLVFPFVLIPPENTSLDLEGHSNAYTGLAKLYRLQCIANK